MCIEHEVSVLCVISEPEYAEMCDEYGFNYVSYPNNPVGTKINNGIKYAFDNYDWDYLMIMNSDSVIKPELFDYYNPLFGKYDFFGVSRVTFVNFYTDEAVDFDYQFSILGVGKCLSRKAIEKVREPYKALDKCLDDTMYDNMVSAGIFPYCVKYEGQLVYDLKSDVNIHPWEKFAKKGKPVESCFKHA